MAFVYSMADTWTDAGVTYTAVKMNVTDTASAAASLLEDLQVGGVTKFSVRKDGKVNLSPGSYNNAALDFGAGNGFSYYLDGIYVTANGAAPAYIKNGINLLAGGFFSWTADGTFPTGAPDTGLKRNAAAVVEINNGTAGAFADLKLRNTINTAVVATAAAAPTIASAATIAPVVDITFVSGTAGIATITAPAPISVGGGTITIIPTGLFTWTTAGNIAVAGAAVVSRALTFTYDVTTVKWYPSYV